MNPRPQSVVYLSYLIPNATDNTLYYPQAVVRNSQTGVVVATINLVQDTNLAQRYTGSFMTPGDSTGQGYYLDVTTTPYTDSGHTTPSLNYLSDAERFFVYQAPSNYGGGYMELTPKIIREIVEENIRSIKFPEIPKSKEVDLSDIHATLSSIEKSHKELHDLIDSLPKFEKTDLSEVHGKFEIIKTEINAVKDEVRETSKTHHAVVMDNTEQMKSHKKAITDAMKEVEKKVEVLSDAGIQVHVNPSRVITQKGMSMKEVYGHLNK